MMSRIITILLVAMSVFACDQRKYEKACNLDALFACGAEHLADSTTIAQTMKGKWQWNYLLSCNGRLTDDPKNDNFYEGLIIEFNDGGTGQYTQKNSIRTFSWELERLPSGTAFEINDLENTYKFPPHDALFGVIYICNDQLLFSSRGTDGVDNLFTRL